MEVVCQSNTGASVITSGGGFATHLPAPSYQASAVASYLKQVTPPAGFGKGKGIPDVSLLGTDYTIVYEDIFTTKHGGDTYITVDGTSASTPVVAAMITLINDARLNRGRSTLGWIHPSLYQHYELFSNDITSGSNFCTAGFDPTCCSVGFNATKGWDPTTGFGSINFEAFYDFYTRPLRNRFP